jgi:starch synthase
MDPFLWQRKDDLYGILNGIDYKIWDPEIDKHISCNYSVNNLSGKLINKKNLLEKFNLPFDKNIPLIVIVSRLAIQKGFDIITDALADLIKLDAQWIILGTGQSMYENLFRSLSKLYPRKFGAFIGYNNDLAHLVEAGADIFLMPSKYEPCGLSQLYSHKYGTVPVVRKTGGLADTVKDWNEFNEFGLDTGDGFSFSEYSGKALLLSVKRAINNFHNVPVWRKIQYNGMIKDYSWRTSAKKYVDLYQKAESKRKSLNR